ncbi:MAG: reductase, partial [Candidatus Rokubacteria bacterium]|nr:reductase [Candidatus Rokubacteria bacterium]
MSHVRYIDKTREYYLGEGYDTPYRWAHFDDVPFTPLARPLGECRVGLVTTSEMVIRGREDEIDRVEEDPTRPVYALPMDTFVKELYSRKASYDRYATTLEDVDAYLPLTHLHRFVEEGRIAGLAPRFQVV